MVDSLNLILALDETTKESFRALLEAAVKEAEDRLSAQTYTFAFYENQALKTAKFPGRGTVLGLAYCALGLGEAGEVQGKVKKILRDSNGVLTDDKKEAIAAELGDLLWYVAAMADALGVPLETIARANIAKLADREARGVIKGDGDSR